MVFSTYVEVIPSEVFLSLTKACFLHVCGGDPKSKINTTTKAGVFSTYVEVILLSPVV